MGEIERLLASCDTHEREIRAAQVSRFSTVISILC